MSRSSRCRVAAFAGFAVIVSACAADAAPASSSFDAEPVAAPTTIGSSVPELSTTTSVAAGAHEESTDADVVRAVAVPPAVFVDATFDVRMTSDVVYAQALSHDSWGGEETETIDLLLDVYEPIRTDDAVMPAVVMIHGGGFTGGSKEHRALSGMATWFAERGWVAYSINYRLAGDVGSLPADYPEPPVPITEQQADQWRALYPACRDAKAAIRWVKATAADHRIDPERVAVVGGSAGSNLAITLAVSDESDCTDEVSIEDDPTLASTHLDQSSEVATVIDHWGGTAVLTVLELLGGSSRFDPTDTPMSIVHGTNDTTVAFSEAERLRSAYESNGVAHAWHPLEGAGHAAWGATIDDRPLVEAAADFIVEVQGLDRD